MYTSPETTTDDNTTHNDNTASTSSTLSSTLTSPSSTAISNANLTTVYTPDHRMDAGAGVGVAIALVLIFLVFGLVVYYLRKTGKLKCLAYERMRSRPRRSSTSSSRRALEPEDTESVDNMPRLTEGDMFAIAEPEDNEREPAGDDGYFYDEVFGSSAFEDETTKASNKELFSVSSDPEVPDLLLRVDDLFEKT